MRKILVCSRLLRGRVSWKKEHTKAVRRRHVALWQTGMLRIPYQISCVLMRKLIAQFFRKRYRGKVCSIPAWMPSGLKAFQNQPCSAHCCKTLPAVVNISVDLYFYPAIIRKVGGGTAYDSVLMENAKADSSFGIVLR